LREWEVHAARWRGSQEADPPYGATKNRNQQHSGDARGVRRFSHQTACHLGNVGKESSIINERVISEANTQNAKVAILGAGLAGCLAALKLATSGQPVTLIDRMLRPMMGAAATTKENCISAMSTPQILGWKHTESCPRDRWAFWIRWGVSRAFRGASSLCRMISHISYRLIPRAQPMKSVRISIP
jgi:hypothetical protein